MFGPEHGRGFGRYLIGIFACWTVAWLGVAALITLSALLPRNPVPLILLAAWAVLAACSLVIPGDSRLTIREDLAEILLALPFLPLARAMSGIRSLPEAAEDLLEGISRYRLARWWRKRAK